MLKETTKESTLVGNPNRLMTLDNLKGVVKTV
jgi:hypothetical protein